MSNIGGGDGSGLVQLPLALARLRGQNMAGACVPSDNFARGGEMESLGSPFVRLQLSSGQMVPPWGAKGAKLALFRLSFRQMVLKAP